MSFGNGYGKIKTNMNGHDQGNREKNQRWLLFGCLIFLLVVAVGLAVAFVVMKGKSDIVDEPEQAINVFEEIASGNLSPEKLEEYIKLSEAEIESASDDKTKSEMYLNRAGLVSNYLSNPEYDFKAQVLSDAQKAERLNPTAYTAFFLSQCEQNYGDEAKAQEYRKIADERGFNPEELGGK